MGITLFTSNPKPLNANPQLFKQPFFLPNDKSVPATILWCAALPTNP